MKERQYVTRVFVVALIMMAVWGILLARLTYLHVFPRPELQNSAKKTRPVTSKIPAGRGRIFDRNGNIIALDVTLQDVCIDPQRILESGTGKAMSAQLGRVLGVSPEYIFEKINRPKRRREVVKRFEQEEVVNLIKRMRLTQSNYVYFEEVNLRQYPLNELGSHVVGFANREGVGSGGIEQRWDSDLTGSPGFRLSEKDGRRTELYTRRMLEIEPQEGADVYLTLDQNVQYFVEKVLDAAMTNYNANACWAIVQKVRTGEILAMASRPAFDPNRYNEFDANARLNRTIGINYEPGSVFKVSVVAAALNDGIIDPSNVYNCENGRWFYGGRPLKDFSPNGELDVTGILKKSSNIGTAKIALELGPERLHHYLKEFGVGRKTGIELPGEEAGLLHPLKSWSGISITRVAMGHEVMVTALQMLNVMCTIGNDGYRMKPYIVRQVIDKNGILLKENIPEQVARPITERTASRMCRMLSAVTEKGGTGYRARIPGYEVLGKTGTAEKVVNGTYDSSANVASFMGLLPAERPEIGIIVVIDEPKGAARTGGSVAAPVFAQMAEPIARHLSIPSTEAEEAIYYTKAGATFLP